MSLNNNHEIHNTIQSYCHNEITWHSLIPNQIRKIHQTYDFCCQSKQYSLKIRDKTFSSEIYTWCGAMASHFDQNLRQWLQNIIHIVINGTRFSSKNKPKAPEKFTSLALMRIESDHNGKPLTHSNFEGSFRGVKNLR